MIEKLRQMDAKIASDYPIANGATKAGKVGARYQDILGRPNGYPFNLSKQFLDDIFLQAARRDVNVQSWRDRIASGAFKTIAHLFWWRNVWSNN